MYSRCGRGLGETQSSERTWLLRFFAVCHEAETFSFLCAACSMSSSVSVHGNGSPASTARIALPPISELQELTDIVLIQKLLNDATQLEAMLQQDLEHVMAKSDQIEAKLEYIDVIPCVSSTTCASI